MSGLPLRRAACVTWAAATALVLAGCELEDPRARPTAHPSAGLYTPGNQLGASDPTDVPTPGMGLGDRCLPLGASADGGTATPGALTVEYATRSLDGRYAPKNCTATWIETLDGRYVATIEVRAALRRPGLWYWQDHACVDKTGPDVVTSATLPDHDTLHVATWQGLDLDGMPVPDGRHVLRIEVTESDKEPGELTTVELEKGPAPWGGEMPVDFEGPLTELSVTWEPEAMGGP